MTADSPRDRSLTFITIALLLLGLAVDSLRVLLYAAIALNAVWVLVRLVAVMRGQARLNRVAEVLPIALVATAGLATQAIASGNLSRALIIVGSMAAILAAMYLYERGAKPQ